MRLFEASGAMIADEHIVDQIRRRREKIVVGRGNDFGEDRSHQQRAEKCGQTVQRRIGEDLAGMLRDFARRKYHRPDNSDRNDERFEQHGADDPSHYRAAAPPVSDLAEKNFWYMD